MYKVPAGRDLTHVGRVVMVVVVVVAGLLRGPAH